MGASRSNHFYFFVSICASLLLIPSSCHTNHVALFIFGDSLFDAGNNNYINYTRGRANSLPYGETFFKHPTGRFSDGRIIPDFIAEYANLPLIPAYLQPNNHQFTYGVNFAAGGAGALADTYKGFVIDLKTQLSYFKNAQTQLRKKLGDAETKLMLSSAVFLFSIGSNDYLSLFVTNTSAAYSKEEYVGMVIGNLTTVIKEIYKKGGKKFGFLNIGPLGCIPSMKALYQESINGCVDEANVLAKLHNEALSKVLKELERNHKGFKYSDFDFYTSACERINNPAKYGFKESKAGCCGTGPYRGIVSCGGRGTVKQYELCDNVSEYLFFDEAHPTEKANNQFAKLMWRGSPQIVRPYNIKTLLET